MCHTWTSKCPKNKQDKTSKKRDLLRREVGQMRVEWAIRRVGWENRRIGGKGGSCGREVRREEMWEGDKRWRKQSWREKGCKMGSGKEYVCLFWVYDCVREKKRRNVDVRLV